MTATDVEKAQAAAAPASKLSEFSNRELMGEVRLRYAEGKIDDERFQVLDFYEDDGIEDGNARVAAVHRWKRGERRETLHQLELALGRDFIGLGEIKPEDLR